MAFRKQEKTVFLVVGLDIISTILKFVLAFFTGSLALLADAWHSLGDLGTSIIVLFALVFDRREQEKIQSEPVNKKPLILRRCGWELRVSTIIGVLLLFVAYGVLQKVISGDHVSDISNKGIAFIFVLLLILLSYIKFKFEASVGYETKSPALSADAHHSKVDLYVLTLIIFSLVGEKLGYRIDRWVAIFIGFLILGIAIRLIFRSAKLFFHLSKDSTPDERSDEERLDVFYVDGLSRHQ